MAKIISSFKEKPKLKETWWTIRLGLASLFAPFLGIINGFVRRVIDPISVNNKNIGIPMGFSGVVLALVLSISGVIVSIRSYRQGERTWLLWIGFILALLVASFMIFMIVGEFILQTEESGLENFQNLYQRQFLSIDLLMKRY